MSEKLKQKEKKKEKSEKSMQKTRIDVPFAHEMTRANFSRELNFLGQS